MRSCAALVALIDRTEFHRRLDAFARDEGGHQGLTLPGWEKFRERVGGDPAARTLFVDMQRRKVRCWPLFSGSRRRICPESGRNASCDWCNGR